MEAGRFVLQAEVVASRRGFDTVDIVVLFVWVRVRKGVEETSGVLAEREGVRAGERAWTRGVGRDDVDGMCWG